LHGEWRLDEGLLRIWLSPTAALCRAADVANGGPTGGRDNWGVTGSGERAGVRQDRASRPQASPLDYDAEVRRHDDVLRRAWGVQPHEHVVDIGCGLGQTTCAAARMAYAGSALGVDISASAVERARELARAQGIGNVGFECADAQVHLFPQDRFDLAVSRFGSMFFADPVAAFSNVGQALRPAGRLVMMVWQARDRNEWDVAIRQALAGPGGSAATASAGSQAFSLAHPPTVRGILEAAGFAGVTFTDVHEPVYYGPDVAAALDWVRSFACTRQALDQLDHADAASALGRLQQMLAVRLGKDGVWFGSRAWIVTARRR
jgi:SAM-dependent methyltransferase